MTTTLAGALLDGATSGLLADSTRISKIRVSTTSALTGTLTVSDRTGLIYTSSAGLSGVESIGVDAFGPAYFNLTNAADLGKASISWLPR